MSKKRQFQTTLTDYGIKVPRVYEPAQDQPKRSYQLKITDEQVYTEISLGIVGSRVLTDEATGHALIERFIKFAKKKQWIIKKGVSGGAKGADSIAESYCNMKSIQFEKQLPYKHLRVPHCFHERNQRIVDDSDVVLALWDGKSTGTLDTLRKAVKAKKPAYVMDFTKKEPEIEEFKNE